MDLEQYLESLSTEAFAHLMFQVHKEDLQRRFSAVVRAAENLPKSSGRIFIFRAKVKAYLQGPRTLERKQEMIEILEGLLDL